MWFWIIASISFLLATLFRSGIKHSLPNDVFRPYKDRRKWGVSDVLRVIGFSAVFPLVFLGLPGLYVYTDGVADTARYCDSELVALSTGSSVEGQIYLSLFGGSGSVNDYQTITFLERAGNGVRLSEKRADYSIIVESATEKPRLKCVNVTKTYDPSFILPWLPEFEYHLFNHYEFTVPEGTVSTSYNVAP